MVEAAAAADKKTEPNPNADRTLEAAAGKMYDGKGNAKPDPDPNADPKPEPDPKPAEGDPKPDPKAGKDTDPPAEPKKDGDPEAKPKGEEKDVPEKYDLKLPEGSPLEAKAAEDVAARAKELGMTAKQAQALLDGESHAVANRLAAQQEELKTVSAAWLDEVKGDQDLGGESYKETAALTERALAKYGTPELKKILNDTQTGNHPDVVRFFRNVGRDIGADQIVSPGGKPSKAVKSTADKMYPSTEGLGNDQ